jgi:hypothetical protein
VAGKHELGTKASVLLFVTTAALRGLLVVAAVVLGVFVLSRAFAPGGEPPPVGAPGPTVAPSPIPEEEPPPEEAPPEEAPEREARQEGVVIDVLNGTNETGLAQGTADELDALGYEIRQVGNAARNYDETTIFFRRGSRPEAEHLANLTFEGAVLDRMQDDADSEAELIVVLGLDFVNG